MTPLPPGIAAPGAKAAKSLAVWRLEREAFIPAWQEGVGAHRFGGRWNPKGQHVVYASLDPASTILELAVHAGFEALDAVPHVLLCIEILTPGEVFVLEDKAVPRPGWLLPGNAGTAQQAFGGALLQAHPFVAVPSVVSRHSWNLLINPVTAQGKFRKRAHARFQLDPRLAARL